MLDIPSVVVTSGAGNKRVKNIRFRQIAINVRLETFNIIVCYLQTFTCSQRYVIATVSELLYFVLLHSALEDLVHFALKSHYSFRCMFHITYIWVRFFKKIQDRIFDLKSYSYFYLKETKNPKMDFHAKDEMFMFALYSSLFWL